MKTIIHFLVSAVAIIITAYVLPGVEISGFLPALILAIVLGAINTFLRPLLLLLTLPLTIFTLGLFALVINGLLVMLASYLVPGFSVVSFWWAILFGIVLAAVSFVLGAIGRD